MPAAKTLNAAPSASPKGQPMDKETVQRYMPLVRSIARRVSFKLPKHYDLEDLVSDGVVGLLAAIDRFDTSRGVKFETFATYYIKGSILDNLPKLPVSQVYQNSADAALEEYSTEEETDTGQEEIETESAVLYNKVTQLTYNYILSLDAPTGGEGDESYNLLSQLGTTDIIHREIEFEELQGILRLAIEQLPYQERTTFKY